MIKIVVIDDDADMELLIKARFRRQISQQLYTFLFARDGQQGLSFVRSENDVDVVLIDVDRPGMNGFDVLSELATIHSIVGTVVVSAHNRTQNIRTAMNRGAFDFVAKPIDFVDLALTIEKTAQFVYKQRETQQLKVINELKTRFFDNITHEFRTPLTLILSPVEKLLRVPVEPDELRRSLLLVERNAQQMLRLINQLLDLTKLEAGHLTLSPRRGDLTAFVSQIVQSFKPMADERHIELVFASELEELCEFDGEKIEQIVYNLIMNALKFTVAGRITVQLQQAAGGYTRLKVTDTGVGIVAEKLPNVFNRFYQALPTASRFSQLKEQTGGKSLDLANSGTGIGLALIKELAELMKGTVAVESKISSEADHRSGSVFTVDLLLERVAGTRAGTPNGSAESGAAANLLRPSIEVIDKPAPRLSDEEKALILVVEDNTELRAFIADELSSAFRVITAADGEDGWAMAKMELPDVVLTDVMMPGMDGYELTHRLKNDVRTDHIAVVMLTAKTAHPSRIEGLKQGADDYISKPFQLDELHLRLHNLLKRQRTLQAHYQQILSASEAPLPTEAVPDKFIQKLQTCLEHNLDNSEYGVSELAFDIGMSRRTLYRKLMAIAQTNINEFMRQYRLRRALQFLREGRNVSETAYLVGYESPGHFTSVFKEFYQKTPSEFVRH